MSNQSIIYNVNDYYTMLHQHGMIYTNYSVLELERALKSQNVAQHSHTQLGSFRFCLKSRSSRSNFSGFRPHRPSHRLYNSSRCRSSSWDQNISHRTSKSSSSLDSNLSCLPDHYQEVLLLSQAIPELDSTLRQLCLVQTRYPRPHDALTAPNSPRHR